MKNIYEYGEQCLNNYMENNPYEEFMIKRFEGHVEEIEDFVDLLEVMANYMNLDWKIYTHKDNSEYWYVEVWNKSRNRNYAANIKDEVDPKVDYIGDRKEFFELVEKMYFNVGFRKMISKLKELEEE